MRSMETEVAPHSRWAQTVGWLGIAGHLVLLFGYAVSELLVPNWVVGLLVAIWVALLVAASWLRRTRPLLVPLVPAAGLVIWFVVVTGGSLIFGWTA